MLNISPHVTTSNTVMASLLAVLFAFVATRLHQPALSLLVQEQNTAGESVSSRWTVPPSSHRDVSTSILEKYYNDSGKDFCSRGFGKRSNQLPYISYLFQSLEEWENFLDGLEGNNLTTDIDCLWEQVKLEAMSALVGPEPEAGPQLYQGILSQSSLVEAVVTVIAQEIQTELIPATALKNLFLEKLIPCRDYRWIHDNVVAAATRSPSVGTALPSILFHMGLHALICQRVGHRLWLENRKGLAYYLQSIVSQRYSADIHPAARLGRGLYLCCSAGVVIGETVTIGDHVSILHGVTLGGTGKERGDRHPKVGHGVTLQDGATVLGNIHVGDGSVVTAKSIVTKPVPTLAIMSGVPARVIGYRELTRHALMQHDLDRHLAFHYLETWAAISRDTVPKIG